MSDAGIHLRRVYAQALFDLAEQSQMIDAVKGELDAITAVISGDKDFEAVISSPCFYSDFKEKLVNKVFSGKLNELTMDFLMVAIRHNRMAFLPQIAAQYDSLWQSYHNYCPVKVTVSVPMSANEVEKLSAGIASAINRKVKMDVAVEPSIIGGVIIRYGDKIIDNTVRHRLQQAVKTVIEQAKSRGKQ
jgi:F-type H+-transporting ATPase subunit delta